MPHRSSLKANIILEEKDVLNIKGPAAFECKGEAHILGVPVGDRELSIRGDIQIPVETGSQCHIAVHAAQSVQVSNRHSSGTFIWRDTVQHILDASPRSVAIIGKNDTGKSTFSVYLANELISAGGRAVLIDSDIGQGDLAAPTCIGGVLRYKPLLSGRLVKPHRWGFIGRTSPHEVEDLIIKTICQIEKGFSKGTRLINTDGYVDVDGPGFEYKRKLIDSTGPDIICVPGNTEIYKNFSELYGDRVLSVPAPDIPWRTPAMRREKRLKQFRRFLRNAGYRTIALDDMHFWYKGRFCSVDEIPGPLLHRFAGLTVTTDRERKMVNDSPVSIERRLGEIGIGVIRSVDEETQTVSIQSRYTGDFDTILLGAIRFDMSLSRAESIEC